MATMTTTTKTNSGNPAATSQEAVMASTFSLGSVVVNFGTTAKVVGFFAAADGRPCEQTGWPILRAFELGKLRGGKWVADPSKCQPVAQ